MQVYFENSFVTLSYDREARLGVAQWRGRLRGPEIREAFLLVLAVIDRFSLTRWLADDRFMESIEPEDLEWSLNVWVPRLAVTSLLRMARLPSYSEENCEMVETMIDKGQGHAIHLVHRNFPNEKEAMDWLMQPLYDAQVNIKV